VVEVGGEDLGLGEVATLGEVVEEEEAELERAASQGRKGVCVSGVRSQDTDSRNTVNIRGQRKPSRPN
jgi:hypothetical protein